MKAEEIKERKIILFDGVCNLCNGSVTFILKHEKDSLFQFASVESEAGKELLEWFGLPRNYSQAIVFLDYGMMYHGSTAALKIGRQLKFPWSILAWAGFTIPRILRDRVYNWIAQNRYRWFGKRETCMLPTENLKTRFL